MAQRWSVRWFVLVFCMALLALAAVGRHPALAQSDGGGGPMPQYAVDVPGSIPLDTPISIEVSKLPAAGDATAQLEVGGNTYGLSFSQGVATAEGVTVSSGSDATVQVLADGAPVPFTPEVNPVALGIPGIEAVTSASIDVLIPGWVTVIPAVLAIGLALVFKKVLPALFGGIWLAGWIASGFSLVGIWTSLLDVFQVRIAHALAPPSGDGGNMAIVLFTFFIGGTVGIITRNGGTKGLVQRFTGLASTPQQAQLTTGALGVGIFFGGYTSSLVVGNAMRPVTDAFAVSREKLAYSVDSTASPIATLMIVSTWVGYQVGLIDAALSQVGGIDAGAYAVFLRSIPYSFYAFMAIYMVFLIGWTGRDYGPMLKVERRARRGQVESDEAQVDDEEAQQQAGAEGQDLVPKPGVPGRTINAAGPIGVLVIGVCVALYATGEGSTLWERIGSADSGQALVYSSSVAMLVAFIMTLGQRLLTLAETIDAWFAGVKSVLFVLFILTLAWALSAATQDLHTGEYLANLLGDAIPPMFLPTLIFLLAAGIAFAVGTSWGTMGILTPLVVPLAYTVLTTNGLMTGGSLHPLFLASIAAVLGGAVWGDHCSPISDTTIISALSSGCEVIEHTRTQLPYAMLSAGVGVVLGHIPVGLGVPWWIAIPLCAVGTTAFVLIVGQKSDDLVPDAEHDLVDETDGSGDPDGTDGDDTASGDTDEPEDIREGVLVGSVSNGDRGKNSSTRFGL